MIVMKMRVAHSQRREDLLFRKFTHGLATDRFDGLCQ